MAHVRCAANTEGEAARTGIAELRAGSVAGREQAGAAGIESEEVGALDNSVRCAHGYKCCRNTL